MESTNVAQQKTGKNARVSADLALFCAALVWGTGFAIQRIAAQHLGVFFFNGFRFLLGSFVLLALIRFKLHIEKKDFPWVLLAGALLFTAGGLQQAGLRTTNAANAGFITGLYTLLVPIILWAFFKKKISPLIWVAAAVAVFGNLLLSLGKHFQINPGDYLEFAGAILWAVHIIVINRQADHMDALQLNTGQLIVAGILNLIAGLIFEPQSIAGFSSVYWTILYSGLLPVGLGFTLQVIGQKHAPPADAALIMSMEAVFGAIFGFLILGETLTFLQIFGCALIFGAIVLSQYPISAQALNTTSPATLDRGG